MKTGMTLVLVLAGLAFPVPQNVTADASAPWPKPKICPVAATGWNSQELVGKKLPVAKSVARKQGCTVRVARRNGEDLAVTEDYRTDRVNVAIRGEQRRVVRILWIG